MRSSHVGGDERGEELRADMQLYSDPDLTLKLTMPQFTLRSPSTVPVATLQLRPVPGRRRALPPAPLVSLRGR